MSALLTIHAVRICKCQNELIKRIKWKFFDTTVFYEEFSIFI